MTGFADYYFAALDGVWPTEKGTQMNSTIHFNSNQIAEMLHGKVESEKWPELTLPLIQQGEAAIFWRTQFEAYAQHYEWCARLSTEGLPDRDTGEAPVEASCNCGLFQRRQEAAQNPEPVAGPPA